MPPKGNSCKGMVALAASGTGNAHADLGFLPGTDVVPGLLDALRSRMKMTQFEMLQRLCKGVTQQRILRQMVAAPLA